MKRIVVLTTGGTIATRAVGGRGATPRLSGADLLRAVPEAAKFARLRTVEVARIPGGAMSLDLMLDVAARAERASSSPTTCSPTTCRGTRRG